MAGTRNLTFSLWLVVMPCMGVLGVVAGCQQKSTTLQTPAKAASSSTFLTENLTDIASATPLTESPPTEISIEKKPSALLTSDHSSRPISSTQNSQHQQSATGVTSPSPKNAPMANATVLPVAMVVMPSENTKDTQDSPNQTATHLAAKPILVADSFHAIITPSKPQQAYLIAIHAMTQKMTGKLEDADSLFVQNMLIHHQTAIACANIQLKYGKDETLLTLAQDTLTAQQAEANLLSQWLKTHTPKKSTTANLKALQTEYSQNIQDMSNAMLKGVSTSNADRAFVQVLLPHHKGALAMAESELNYGKDKAVRDIAVNIISSQQGEITLMKNWLNAQRKH